MKSELDTTMERMEELFEFTKSQRAELSDRKTVSVLARCKFLAPEQFESWLDLMKERGLPRLRELEVQVDRVLKAQRNAPMR